MSITMRNRLKASGDWFFSGDPGRVRLYGAVRAALAVLSAWWVMRTLVQLLIGKAMPTVVLFAVASGLFCFIGVLDARPTDRRLTWVLAIIPLAAGVALAALLDPVPPFSSVALLALMFLSYSLRRYGPRPGELSLLATIGLYFGSVVRPSFGNLHWFLLATLAGVLLAGLWEFVLMPYNPVGALRRSIADFYYRTAVTVEQVTRSLDGAQAGSAGPIAAAQRSLRNVRHCRSVIESLGAAAVSPSLWTDVRLRQLEVDLYTAEQGLALVIDGAAGLTSGGDQIPPDLRESLQRALEALQHSLASVATPKAVDELAKAGEELRQRAGADASAGLTGSWALPLLRIGAGGHELARAVAHSRSLDPLAADAQAETEQASPPAGGAAIAALAAAAMQRPQQKGRHLTTLLGLQAVLAVGLAMLLAWILGLSHANWVF